MRARRRPGRLGDAEANPRRKTCRLAFHLPQSGVPILTTRREPSDREQELLNPIAPR
jgi:hypothetical protein